MARLANPQCGVLTCSDDAFGPLSPGAILQLLLSSGDRLFILSKEKKILSGAGSREKLMKKISKVVTTELQRGMGHFVHNKRFKRNSVFF